MQRCKKSLSLEAQCLFQLWEQLLICDGVQGVTGGHLGETKVLEKLKERFYWPGHVRDVKNWCQSCSACAQRKHPTARNKAKLQTVREGYSMQMVATDILGPFPESESGNLYILVATRTTPL